MTNFDFLLRDPQFDGFARVAVSAEKILHIDPAACALNCRRAMEFAVKWLYSVDSSLSMPDDDRLVRLMDSRPFRELVGEDLWKKMKLIRSLGNNAAHDGDKISRSQAELCLENLFDFLDFVAYCYSSDYKNRSFDHSLVDTHGAEEAAAEAAEVELERLMAENAALRADLTARRESQRQNYVPRPLDHSEYNTRKIYIEAMLIDAGWTPGCDCMTDVSLSGTSAGGELGEADYILYDEDDTPLAVIEARRSCMDIDKGRQQALLCAELLEKQYGRRPVIFLTDGFDIYINDGFERRIAALYSRADLRRRLSLSSANLEEAAAAQGIADRDYQRDAVSAVCKAFSQGRRKALLAMAPGTGKTRIAAAVCELMLRLGLAQNILYLAENSTLAAQAKNVFARLLPSAPAANLCCGPDVGSAPMIFATWENMSDSIDRLKNDDGRIFTCGRFDLIICDEAHGAAVERYRDVFNYFDAPILGMTIAPSDTIDPSVYELFDSLGEHPTYSYDMARAVKDGYLVDFRVAEAKVKFIRHGINYSDLSAKEQAEYRLTFAPDGHALPAAISAAFLNRWVFNADTIREALAVVTQNAVHVNKGRKIGKTIIFAANDEHANMIFDVYRSMYPRHTGYAKVIGSHTRDTQEIIDRFADPKRLPQIVISAGCLDSGVDIPHVVNLVFFRQAADKARFWQMIGRGSRPCRELWKGQEKRICHVFDLCGNFEIFRTERDEDPLPLPGELFALRARLICALQEPEHHTPELSRLRSELVGEMAGEIKALDRNGFAVRQHLRYVDFFSEEEHYSPLTAGDAELIAGEIAPLITSPLSDDLLHIHRLFFRHELALLEGRPDESSSALLRRLIPAAENAAVPELERIRRSYSLRLPAAPIITDFDDELLSVRWLDSGLRSR